MSCSNITTISCVLSGARHVHHTLSSREFNQAVTRAKKAAYHARPSITERGKPSHVLLNIDEYRRANGEKRTLVNALSMPGLAEIAFDPPHLGALPVAAEFD